MVSLSTCIETCVTQRSLPAQGEDEATCPHSPSKLQESGTADQSELSPEQSGAVSSCKPRGTCSIKQLHTHTDQTIDTI